MKRSLYIAMSLLFVTGFVACNEGTEVGEVDLGYLKLISTDVDFGFEGGAGKIVADTDGAVTAVPNDPWATTSVSGNVVTVTVGKFMEFESRSTFITVSANNRSVNVPVTQSTYFPSEIDAETLAFTKQGGTQTVNYLPVDTPSVGVDLTKADSLWISADIVGNGVVRLTATPNTGSARSSTIYVRLNGNRHPVLVSQDSALSLSNSSLSFTAATASQNVAADITGGMSLSAASSQTWATATVDNTTNTVTVKVENNYPIAVLAQSDPRFEARTATVTVTAGSGANAVNATITVNQAAIAGFSAWANITYNTPATVNASFAKNKAVVLEKADGVNLFRIYGVNYNTATNQMMWPVFFEWDVTNAATSLTLPVGHPSYGTVITDIPVLGQEIGITSTFEGVVYRGQKYITTDTALTYYTPETKTFQIRCYHGFLTPAGYRTWGGWMDDTFIVDEFLQGNPWE